MITPATDPISPVHRVCSMTKAYLSHRSPFKCWFGSLYAVSVYPLRSAMTLDGLCGPPIGHIRVSMEDLIEDTGAHTYRSPFGQLPCVLIPFATVPRTGNRESGCWVGRVVGGCLFNSPVIRRLIAFAQGKTFFEKDQLLV
ncbi:hypothetical protein RSAG8_07757, partial [Rhizoctonia solani AG-8 WAC10335]